MIKTERNSRIKLLAIIQEHINNTIGARVDPMVRVLDSQTGAQIGPQRLAR